jgi:hypothetical protein
MASPPRGPGAEGFGFFGTLFYVSKYYEFVDTWILVPRGPGPAGSAAGSGSPGTKDSYGTWQLHGFARVRPQVLKNSDGKHAPSFLQVRRGD